MQNYPEYLKRYRDELLYNVIPFWIKNSNDEQYGGYLTCLNQKGEIYDTDKFIWPQARQVYILSFLFNEVGANDLWLGFAFQGSGFLQKYGRNEDGYWYFALNQAGKPLSQPYSIFSDCFASLAFGSMYKATEIDEFGEIARNTFQNIIRRKDNPKGIYSKLYPGTRLLKNASLPMILVMLLQEIESLLNPLEVEELYASCIHDMSETFYESNTGLLLENVNIDGSFSDSMDGRLICPGSIFEGMWFLMDLADKRGSKSLMDKACQIVLNAINYSWDEEYGGIFYFMDIKNAPLQQLEWDQKLWWVHVEALTSLLKAYYYTGNFVFWNWFKKVDEYTWQHFPDAQYGEWFGYLNRQGDVSVPLKGGKWKGCYHIPRALYQCWQIFEKLYKENPEH